MASLPYKLGLWFWASSRESQIVVFVKWSVLELGQT